MHFNLVYLDHVEFGEFMTVFMFFYSPFLCDLSFTFVFTN